MTLSPQASKGYAKYVLLSFPFISLFHVGYLPPLSPAWVVIQMQMQLAGPHPHPWWMLTRVGSVNFAHWGTPQAARALSASDSSSKLLGAPPKDCACQLNSVLQIFVQITCHSPSYRLRLYPSHSPPALSISTPVAWAQVRAGADSQAKFRGGGKGQHTSYMAITTSHTNLAAKSPPLLWCKSTQLPGVVSV